MGKKQKSLTIEYAKKRTEYSPEEYQKALTAKKRAIELLIELAITDHSVMSNDEIFVQK